MNPVRARRLAALVALAAAAGLVVLGCGGGGGGGASFGISSVSPPGGNSDGGTEVTVSGSLFEAGAATVWFGTYDDLTFPAGMTEATAYSQRDSGTIVYTSPNWGSAELVDVVVENPTDVAQRVRVDSYEFVAKPTVSSISPDKGSLGGGRTATITGTGFVDGPGLKVVFDPGQPGEVEATEVVDGGTGTTISCKIPPHAAAAGVDVFVRNGDYGTETLSGAYDYFANTIGAGDGPDVTWGDGSSDTIYIDGSDYPSTHVDNLGGVIVTVGDVDVSGGITVDESNQWITVPLPGLPEGFHDVTWTDDAGANPVTLTDAVYMSNPNFTIYVSDNGDDATGDGTAAAPYRSLTRALQDSPDSGKTILCLCELVEPAVFSRVYGETWDLDWPSGVRLQGLGADVTVVRGGSQSLPIIYALDSGPGTAFDRMGFEDVRNSTDLGAGVMLIEGGQAAISNCTFANNWLTHNESPPEYEPDGGAIVVYDGARCTLTDCVFDGNQAKDCGGAVVVTPGSSLHAVRCHFIDNIADSDGDGAGLTGDGGAIVAAGPDTVLSAVDCDFEQNLGGIGGAISLYPKGVWARLSSCRMYYNNADYVGGGVYALCDDLEMQNCLVDYNRAADGPGGGVAFQDAGDLGARLVNCTIVRNWSSWGWWHEGDGVYVHNTGDNVVYQCFPVLLNTIVAYNDQFGLSEHEIDAGASNEWADPYVDYCCFHGHSDADYIDENSAAFFPANGGAGALDPNTGCLVEDILGTVLTDPDFVNMPSGDFHLTPVTSQCIDAGDPSIEDPDGTVSDMGCYGGHGVAYDDTGTETVGRDAVGREGVLLVDGSELDTVRLYPAVAGLGNDGTAMVDAYDADDTITAIRDSAQFDAYSILLTDGDTSKVLGYYVHPTTGAIAASPGAPSTQPDDAQRVAVDGNRVFVTDSGTTNQVMYYTIRDFDGAMAYVNAVPTLTDEPVDVAVLDGYVVALAPTAMKVRSFWVDSGTGNLASGGGGLDLSAASPTGVDATACYQMEVVGRYLVVHCADAAGEILAVVSVARDTGALAVVGTSLATGNGATQSEAMAVHENKVLLANSTVATGCVRVFAVDGDGAITQAAGSPFSTETGGGGTGTKTLAVGDDLVWCRNATDEDICVWQMNPSTGALSEATAFPFDPSDVAWDSSTDKGVNGMLYLGGGLLLLSGDDTADEKDLFLFTFDSSGTATAETVSDTNVADPTAILHMKK